MTATQKTARTGSASRLTGKNALITGGSRGIGYGIAEAFIAQGARVVITSRHEADVSEAATALGRNALGIRAHAGNPDDMRACVDAMMQDLGTVDILVNNAATSPYWGPLIDIDTARLDKTIEVNLRGPLLSIQICWTASMAERGGCVLNISSIGAGRVGGANGAYRLTKLGLNYLTRHLALELAPKVRVNAIASGLIATKMAQARLDEVERTGSLPPMGRLGSVKDVAAAAVFLCSDEAAWVTGEIMTVDGGSVLRSDGPGAGTAVATAGGAGTV